MSDDEVQARIDGLVEEEQTLLRAGDEGEGLTQEQHDRLAEVRVELDRQWDLLRQRRAERAAGRDPDEASIRDEGTVETYEQ